MKKTIRLAQQESPTKFAVGSKTGSGDTYPAENETPQLLEILPVNRQGGSFGTREPLLRFGPESTCYSKFGSIIFDGH